MDSWADPDLPLLLGLGRPACVSSSPSLQSMLQDPPEPEEPFSGFTFTRPDELHPLATPSPPAFQSGPSASCLQTVLTSVLPVELLQHPSQAPGTLAGFCHHLASHLSGCLYLLSRYHPTTRLHPPYCRHPLVHQHLMSRWHP